MKKILIIILTIVISAGSLVLPTVSAEKCLFSFIDVEENEWYYDEVKIVYEEGVMKGKSDTQFDPTANMSRAEFVTVLCRLSDESCEGKGNNLSFSDTAKEAWYADYVAWGVETEMVKGLPDNKFAPNQAVSRQEMAVFIDRFISYMNIQLKDNSKVDAFGDNNKVADYAKIAIEAMRKSGIITGDQNGNFNPTNKASRAEVATILTRILPLMEKSDMIPNPIIPTVTGEFVLQEEDETPLSYYIYLPENYSTLNKYPIVIYSRDYGDRSIESVGVLFSNIDSPIYDSIVIVPNTIKDSDFKRIDELIVYLKTCYSVDKERIYMISLNDRPSTFYTWQLLIESPNTISAVLFVHGVSATLGASPTGGFALLDDVAYNRLPSTLNEISIGLLHCLDDNRPAGVFLDKKYGEQLYSALEYSGFKNISLTETNGYPDIYDNFVNENDMSQLEWLFAQRRETK